MSIDGERIRRKTKRVALTPEERGRVGHLLKRLRDDRELNQADIADKLRCSTGTVQAIEYNKYKVDRDTLERYAAVFGTTVHALLHPGSPIQLADPSVADLNREHLAIAHDYMRAVKVVRTAVELLLADRSDRTEDLAELVVAVKAGMSRRSMLAYELREALTRGDVVADLVNQLERDPTFEEHLRDLLDHDSSQALEPPTDKDRKVK